jgi:hypothetical protein
VAILIDLNQIMISNIMQHLKGNDLYNEGLIRHMVLNSLRKYNADYSADYGKIIVCCDSVHYWRRDFFPNYKIHRRGDREESSIDWDSLHKTFDKLRKEFKENLPYKVIDVPGTEADDVISILTKNLHSEGPILIISSDKDFLQLQKYPNVAQYSPIQKKFITTDDPVMYLKEHIIRGDKGDGVPNILSDDDCIIDKRRQKSILSEKVDLWTKSDDYTTFCSTENMQKNYKRNEMLIDLTMIPASYETAVMEAYKNVTKHPKEKMIGYLAKYSLTDLLSKVEEF